MYHLSRYLSLLGLGANGDWDFPISDLVKPLMELIFKPCSEFRWSPEGPVSQIHSPHLLAEDPGIFSDLLISVQIMGGSPGDVSENPVT